MSANAWNHEGCVAFFIGPIYLNPSRVKCTFPRKFYAQIFFKDAATPCFLLFLRSILADSVTFLNVHGYSIIHYWADLCMSNCTYIPRFTPTATWLLGIMAGKGDESFLLISSTLNILRNVVWHGGRACLHVKINCAGFDKQSFDFISAIVHFLSKPLC